MNSTDKKRAKNRKEMPNVAQLLDDVRKANPGLKFKVIGAEDKVTKKRVGWLD